MKIITLKQRTMFEIDMKLARYESEIANIGNEMLKDKDTYKWYFSMISCKINDWIKVLQGKDPPDLDLSWGRDRFENSIFQNPDHESIIRGIVDSIDSAKKGGDLRDFDLTNAQNSIPRIYYIDMDSDRQYYRWTTTKYTQLIRSELCKRLNCCACTIHILETINLERDAFRNNSS